MPLAVACSAGLASRLLPREPAPKRLLRFTRSATREKTLHTDVFVKVRPVDPFTAPNQTPVRSLCRRAARQAWEPSSCHALSNKTAFSASNLSIRPISARFFSKRTGSSQYLAFASPAPRGRGEARLDPPSRRTVGMGRTEEPLATFQFTCISAEVPRRLRYREHR